MWVSEVIEQKRQRQAAGPVRYGHLQVFEGGKIAEGVYTQPIGFWRRIFTRLGRQQRSLHLWAEIPTDNLEMSRRSMAIDC